MKNGEGSKGILLVKMPDESLEIHHELAYLGSLTARQRFRLMERKSREMKALLRRHGHRTSASITKRK